MTVWLGKDYKWELEFDKKQRGYGIDAGVVHFTHDQVLELQYRH